MTVENFLSTSTRQVAAAGIITARLDCLVLLEDTLNKNRTHLLAHPELEITTEQEMYLCEQVERRTKHEPLAYIRGKTEFYGHEFIVDKNVLVPRPESETIIDLLKAIEPSRMSTRPRIADVGTGSGALGITAKLELPNAQVDLLEIDEAALNIAKKNINKLSISANYFQSDLLASATTFYDVVIANLPYVPDTFNVDLATKHEPALALFGGNDGLDLYRRLFVQTQALKQKPILVLTEALPTQHTELAKLAKQAGFMLTRTDDGIQQFELVGPSLTG